MFASKDDHCAYCRAQRESRLLSLVIDGIGMAFILLLVLIVLWAALSLLVPQLPLPVSPS